MMNLYKENISQVKASSRFKTDVLQLLENEMRIERRRRMKNFKKVVLGVAASAIIAVGVVSYLPSNTDVVHLAFDLTERMVIDSEAPAACAVVNIEGTIVEVSDDGYSFKLDNGKWVDVTDDTEIGITSPSAAAKEDQFFEPTFRVGNMIAGFTENEDTDRIHAYVIYTNWNWEDSIR